MCPNHHHNHQQQRVSQPPWWPTFYGLNELKIKPKIFLKYLKNENAFKTRKINYLGGWDTCVPTADDEHYKYVSQPPSSSSSACVPTRWWPTSNGLNELKIGPKIFLKYFKNENAFKKLKFSNFRGWDTCVLARWYNIIIMIIIMVVIIIMIVLNK